MYTVSFVPIKSLPNLQICFHVRSSPTSWRSATSGSHATRRRPRRVKLGAQKGWLIKRWDCLAMEFSEKLTL